MSNQKDGWYDAGLQIAKLVSSRPEVKSGGIVEAVKELIQALDRKVKVDPISNGVLRQRNRELLQENEQLRAELESARTKRDFALGVCALVYDRTVDTSLLKWTMAVLEGIGTRKLAICKLEAKRRVQLNG